MALKIKSSNRINPNMDEALKTLTKEKMVTLTILIPESLRDKLKIKAIQNKTNVTNVVLEHLKEYVKE